MPSQKIVSKICQICSREFLVEKTRKTSAKYCSHSCRSKSMLGTKTSLNRICEQCKKPFKGFKGQRWKFCSRSCYDTFRFGLKPCKECFTLENKRERCKKHANEKQSKWRVQASKQELKAKSLQGSYRAASGCTRTLALKDARELIADPPKCPYCKIAIPWHELSIDHKVPKSREGSNDPENLVWVDLECNLIKGNLLESEFMILLNFMEQNPTIKPYLVKRLKAGGGFIYAGR